MGRRTTVLLVTLLAAVLVAGCVGGVAKRSAGVGAAPTVRPGPTRTERPVAQAGIAAPTPTSRPTSTPAPTTVPPTETPAPTPTPTQARVFGLVTPLKLRVHAQPGISAPVTGYLEGGDSVWVLGRDSANTWFYVESENGEKGWVSAQYVDVLGDVSSVPQMAKAPVAAPAPAEVKAPRLSGELFYVSDWQIYEAGFGGKAKPVTHGGEPAVSPSGEWFAFVRGGSEKGLWVRNLRTGEERMLFGGADVRTPRWSGDGGAIYFSVQDETKPATRKCFPPGSNRCRTIPEDRLWHLAGVSFPDGERMDIPSDMHSFSPNELPGGDILYQNEHGLAVTGVGASPRQVLTKPWVISPWLAPNGSDVVCQYRLPQGWAIALVNRDGGAFRVLTSVETLSGEKEDFVSPTWSPDGRYIAALHRGGGDGGWEIVVMDYGGGVVRRIHPAPAPDYPFDGAQALAWGK